MGTTDSISQRLANGEVVILDGGVSTELERRGIPIDPVAWFGRAAVAGPISAEGLPGRVAGAGKEASAR